METTSCAVHIAFRTALLLAGVAKTAELAVLDGIDACEKISDRSLLIGTVRSTIRRRAESPEVLDGINLLPLNSDAFWACRQSFGTALFFEFLSNCLLRCVRTFSIFPSPNTRTLYAER